jgi:hypothetical protein
MAVRQKGRGRDKHRSGSFGVKPGRPPRGEVWRLPVVRGRHRPRVPGDERRRDEGRPLARARACPPHLRVVGATAICPGRRQAINPAHQPTNQVRSIYHCRGRQGREPPFSAGRRPVHPCKRAEQKTLAVGNATGAEPPWVPGPAVGIQMSRARRSSCSPHGAMPPTESGRAAGRICRESAGRICRCPLERFRLVSCAIFCLTSWFTGSVVRTMGSGTAAGAGGWRQCTTDADPATASPSATAPVGAASSARNKSPCLVIQRPARPRTELCECDLLWKMRKGA